MSVTVHHGDSREVLKTLSDASIDAVVCDPPYALVSIGKRFGKEGAAPAKAGKTGAYARASKGFMGKTWDTGETAFSAEFWVEVARVLKPGGHVVAFNGTRTYHRLACAIEDAGFEIRDQLAWAYGSGFPKSHNQSGEWEGWGSALKPAWEPICLARKPLVGTLARNLMAHGTGGLNIDACRIEHEEPAGRPSEGQGGARTGGIMGEHADVVRRRDTTAASISGRWPPQLVHDGSDEVIAALPAEAGAFAPVRGTEPSNAVVNVYGERTRVATLHHGDSGTAARFFYSAKADAEDRLGSKHPTVKPVDLMAWLCRLVTPPGGVVLDPFAGTGTTGLAAMREGFDCILIEREAEYVADIERRLAWAKGDGRLTAQEMARTESKPVDDLPLFSTPDVAA